MRMYVCLYVNKKTGKESLIVACSLCFASLFTDRAIFYRNNLGIINMPRTWLKWPFNTCSSEVPSSIMIHNFDTP